MTILRKIRTRLKEAYQIGQSIDQKLEVVIDKSDRINRKLEALIGGMNDQSGRLHGKLEELIEGMNNQSERLHGKLEELIEGMNNQSGLLNRKFASLIQETDKQSRVLDKGLKIVAMALDNQSRLLNSKLAAIGALGNQSRRLPSPEAAEAAADQAASPRIIAENTSDTSHPDRDAAAARNFPGKMFNAELPCDNPLYAEVRKLAAGGELSNEAWTPVLRSAQAEAKTVPHADVVLHRRDILEQYLADLGHHYGGRYLAGSVDIDGALFLYWMVRCLKPKTIVQCGVCNGLSSAFVMLALAKNGPEGQLYAIDAPSVFNSKDPNWAIAGKEYDMVVPEGKTSGWIMPEAYRHRFHVQNGDAKHLLPMLVERLPAIDLFYHSSDHSYDRTMSEIREAKRKLGPGGLIVADDITCNPALWEFADECRTPAYNFKGAVGVAFF